MMEAGVQSPFHAGERQAQRRAGAGDVAQWAGGFIRDFLPEQHRAFYAALPFLVVSGADAEGRVWVTMLDGPDQFMTSPDPRRLTLATSVDPGDPLAGAFRDGAEIGGLGIELASRRRNRFSGVMRAGGAGFGIDIRQSFGNCPQHIHQRVWERVAQSEPRAVRRGDALEEHQVALIRGADTLFIGSGHRGGSGARSDGFDASHRGGARGFVQVVDERHLLIPDYAGNNFFNTVGNLMSDARVGLLFVDFDSGGLVHLTGRATVQWGVPFWDREAQRVIAVEIDRVVERPGAVGLRWSEGADVSRPLRLVRRVAETSDVSSFYFEAADGARLARFEAGQHVTLELRIPGQARPVRRSYSLSGSPGERSFYRLSIKREEAGLVSRFLHDQLAVGGVIRAEGPFGDFAVPAGDGPVVLISAGIGATPLVSMLHALVGSGRQVWFLHAARGTESHVFRDEVETLVASAQSVQQRVFYSRSGPVSSDVAFMRRMTAAQVVGLVGGVVCDFLLCGPTRFVAEMQEGLEALGVEAGRIQSESFGAGGS